MFLRFNSIEKFGRRNLPPIESYNSDHYCGYDSNFETKILEIFGSFAVHVCLCKKTKRYFEYI